MPAPLSVIIPCLNAQDKLPACLAALFEGVENGLIRELILSDGGSTDNTGKIAADVGAVWLSGPASRGGQLQRGGASAKGEWLFFVHADTRLDAGWSQIVHRAIQQKRAGFGHLRFDVSGIKPALVARWANLRARYFGMPFGDQGLLLPKALYQEVGGYSDIPLMEDVAIAKALKGRLEALDFIALTDASRYTKRGWARQGMRNLSLQLRYFLGTDPHLLAQEYRKN